MLKITQTYIVLGSKEVKIVEQCLKYALHRLREHPNAGIKYAVNKQEIEKLLKDIR